MSVRTRFAPSPTGVLHLGGLRTALYNWLYARRHGGEFLLRIEDTDRQRSLPEHIRALVEALQRFGLDPDEEPLLQSSRVERHREVANQLLESGFAYHCYCTPDELAAMREEQRARGEVPRYDGRWRDNTGPPPAGVKPVIRFRRPDSEEVVVRDWLHGDVRYLNSQLDDLVLLRADGSPTYHLSCVVDDEDMGVRQVIRGDDHLNNTPRQLQLIQALGWTAPEYCHLPLLLAPDGKKLSKRDEATDALHYLRAGYLPDAVLNYLARLGWSHGDQEVFTIEELISRFGREGLGASASRLDPDKLNWINQQHMKTAAVEDLCEGLEAQLENIGLKPADGPPLEEVAEAWRERAETLAGVAEAARWAFSHEIELDEKAARKVLRPVVREPLAAVRAALAGLAEWTAAAIHACIAETAETLGIGFGKLGQPLRVAVTGGGVSPPIDTTLYLAGRSRALERLDAALGYIDARIAVAESATQG
ncbi:MAG: glutamate--tRNA ligase [Gammaproteobacteria bacterium]|nr:glutamate--tRNA ligase [Gammaproteobacteria bacterium]MXW44386.1 glutamate--tRNA ligase [Gammaproteobacteria bacterium]MYD02625.1 glutamate--tRNA ligase [Gammaproteobacteria bacterium]MYI26223.1 glutamate--tRNA ligase [Gammaproteobacteria bacterium]